MSLNKISEELLDERKFKMLLKAYKTAVEMRKLEIQLFWNRSLFFWGFIASAFITYAWLRRVSSDISVVVACFGLVCSVAWSFGNRGSKYWQETWEIKVENIEGEISRIVPSVIGSMFSKREQVQKHKKWWLRARKFSVSKLAIALSDYTIFLWASVIAWDCVRCGERLRLFRPRDIAWLKKPWVTTAFIIISLIYVVIMLFAGRTTPRPKVVEKPFLSRSSGRQATP